MSKKDVFLKGGLNALFEGSPMPPQAEPKQEPEQPTQADEGSAEDEETETSPDDVINTIEDEDLRAALHQRRMRGRGRPRKYQNGRGLSDGYGRVTTIVNLKKMDKLRYIALQETLTIKEVLDAAFDVAIERYEERNGKIVLPSDAEARKAKVQGLFKKPTNKKR